MMKSLGEMIELIGKWLIFGRPLTYAAFVIFVAEGYPYTYDNGRGGVDNIQCRLDRALATLDWYDKFPNAKTLHLDREWSDHAPIKLRLNGVGWRERRFEKPFRFEQAEHNECEAIVQSSWDFGGPQKKAMCAADLKEWGENTFGAILLELRKKRKRLKKLNKLSDSKLAERI